MYIFYVYLRKFFIYFSNFSILILIRDSSSNIKNIFSLFSVLHHECIWYVHLIIIHVNIVTIYSTIQIKIWICAYILKNVVLLALLKYVRFINESKNTKYL